MDFANSIIMLGAVLFLSSIVASVMTPRLGVPLLLVFLIVGMLAGEDGPGGIQFGNYAFANLAGTAALAVILFDGGMRTKLENFRVALRPAISLAMLGTFLTAGVTGVLCMWLLDLHWAEGLLIGAIVGSTDASAVFSLLHTNAVKLNQRVTSALEIESGSNDPMAVLMTLGLIHYIQSPTDFGVWDALWLLVKQLGLGALLGWGGGVLLLRAINRLDLPDSLYPLLALFGGLLVYSLTASIGGSGFLAVYIAGLIAGNRSLRGAVGIRRFHDGIAWMAQIGMFVVLGLLVTPSKLLPVAVPGLLIAAGLILVARPIAVWLCLLPFRFPAREKIFIAWVGLRGSVPIVLATFPVIAELEHAALYFNIAFFIVLVSLVVQGWTVAPMAKLLGLQMPLATDQVQRVEIDLPGQRGYEIVSYRLGEDSAVIGRRTKELEITDASRVIAVARKGRLLPYKDWGPLRQNDTVSLLAAEKELPRLDSLFQAKREAQRTPDHHPYFGEFGITPGAPVQALAEIYGVELPDEAEGLSVAQLFARYIPHAVIGDRLRLGEIELVVRKMQADQIIEFGLRLPHPH